MKNSVRGPILFILRGDVLLLKIKGKMIGGHL